MLVYFCLLFCSQGSIQAEYLAYFDDSGPENSAELQDSLTLQLVSAGCSTNYSEKCDMGQFQGLDLSLMTLTGNSSVSGWVLSFVLERSHGWCIKR